nr:hypothetical protein [Tanacetum cinerariifolium]
MLLATKDEAGVHLDEDENDFMLDNANGDDTLKELNAAVFMVTRIQPTDDKSDPKPTYDAEFISEVSASKINMINGLLSKSDHEQRHHEKLETIIHTAAADDQIDYDINFDDPYVDYNKVEKQRKMNIELKKQKPLLQRELETCKKRVKEFENKPEQVLDYKEAYEELQNEMNVEKELLNAKEEICEELLKTQDETLKIKLETDLYKKAFKERENKYLEDILSLEEKL